MKKIAPGVYAGADGTLHLVIPELLRANGYADTPANRDQVARAARELFAEQLPGVPVTETDRPLPRQPNEGG